MWCLHLANGSLSKRSITQRGQKRRRNNNNNNNKRRKKKKKAGSGMKWEKVNLAQVSNNLASILLCWLIEKCSPWSLCLQRYSMFSSDSVWQTKGIDVCTGHRPLPLPNTFPWTAWSHHNQCPIRESIQGKSIISQFFFSEFFLENKKKTPVRE